MQGLARDPEVRAIAPVMPTRLVRPVEVPAAALAETASGLGAVGALGQGSAGLKVAWFSNTVPQIAAPGVAILSAKAGGGLRQMSGTSMATPHVAGIAARWWDEVVASPVPATAALVTARLLAHARTDLLAPGEDVADRGVGIARAP